MLSRLMMLVHTTLYWTCVWTDQDRVFNLTLYREERNIICLSSASSECNSPETTRYTYLITSYSYTGETAGVSGMGAYGQQ
jgi:hypothetical protein